MLRPGDVAWGDRRCPRGGNGRSSAAAFGLAALAALHAGCGSQEPTNAVDVLAVEASFGGSWCRRIEDAATVEALATARGDLERGWRRSWTPLATPSLELVFVGAEGELGRLGIGGGQAQTTADGRQVFQPIDDRAAARFVALAGGPPVGPPDRPCVSSSPTGNPPRNAEEPVRQR